MNKIFKITNNILLIINAIILFSSFPNTLGISLSKLIICSVIVFLLLIIHFVETKNHNSILEKKSYNIMALFVNMVVLTIFIRDMFDYMIPVGSVYDLAFFNTNSASGIFIDYNMIYIIIMYGGILIYNLLNKGKRKIIKK